MSPLQSPATPQRHQVVLSETGDHFSSTDQTEQRSHDTISERFRFTSTANGKRL